MQRNGENGDDNDHDDPDELPIEDMIPHSNCKQRREKRGSPSSDTATQCQCERVERAERGGRWTDVVERELNGRCSSC